MSKLRFRVVETAFKKKAATVETPAERPSEYFAKYVFNREKMFKYLPGAVYAKLTDAMDNGAPLERAIADEVAAGMKRWATELGVTHYTHWFQPLTEGTAEKHDAFVEHDGKGGMMEEFSGKLLVQQEPDASSFPNGGIRNTFEARGYSAWDPSSPVFVVDDTLCIPTVFIAYTGESLDYKTPLLKALSAVGKAAVDVCHYFNPEVKKVVAYLGWEQEYFLVDEGLYAARPDLLLTGRTLMGHEASKNQQLEDHYFGAIPTRVAAFMKDLEIQALELGIPVKTRHNEVAPNQFELAPIFEECNLAVDHNMLLMSLMRKVARSHGFRLLLHEKPFKGVNGSGKHNNWSLGTDTGVLLMAPGKTAEDNLRFITFIVNTLMAVYHHNGLLKASIMSATNAHRLGANEAPPAIISSFLGNLGISVIKQIVPIQKQGIPLHHLHIVKSFQRIRFLIETGTVTIHIYTVVTERNVSNQNLCIRVRIQRTFLQHIRMQQIHLAFSRFLFPFFSRSHLSQQAKAEQAQDTYHKYPMPARRVFILSFSKHILYTLHYFFTQPGYLKSHFCHFSLIRT